jgi:hypothetical protein
VSPPGCMELYEATKGFVTLFEFNVLAHRAEDGVFEDGAFKVEQVKLDRTVDKKCPNLPRTGRRTSRGSGRTTTIQCRPTSATSASRAKPGKLDRD